MFVDKGEVKTCQECGETMKVTRDYGMSGQALECKTCGFYLEEIDLRETTLSDF